MKASALAPQLAPDTSLQILSGPDKGRVYRIVSGRITLGRGADNDVVVPDPKCSRNHAEIVAIGTAYEIRDITDRNVITVDGRECKRATLNNSSVFEMGETQFRFSMQVAAPPAIAGPSAAVPVANWNTGIGIQPQPLMPRPQSGLRKRGQASSSSNFRFIAIGVIGLIVWVGLSQKSKNPEVVVTPEEKMEVETKALEKIKDSATSRPKGVSINDIGYNQAQQAYVTGFQDFRNGQFERAMASFQACLSLYPQHRLCGRYLALTQRKFDELIQYHMVYGKKYRDQGQYGACASAFRNASMMIKDPNNKKYQEAKANYEACAAHLEERF